MGTQRIAYVALASIVFSVILFALFVFLGKGVFVSVPSINKLADISKDPNLKIIDDREAFFVQPTLSATGRSNPFLKY